MCATVPAGWPTVWPTTSRCHPTVVSAVGEQRCMPHHGAGSASYLSAVETCSLVISFAISEMTTWKVAAALRCDFRRSMRVRYRRLSPC
jgi:hypothetical protein